MGVVVRSQEGFVATIDGLDAPFLRPIVVRQIHLKSVRNDAARVDIAPLLRREYVLNLKHVFLHLSGRDIRNLSVGEFPPAAPHESKCAATVGRHFIDCSPKT